MAFRFPSAVEDFKAALVLKQQLYPEEHQYITEAHFFLSLALEFASIKPSTTEGEDDEAGEQQVDQAIRDEAARETQAAIDSIKLQIYNKEVELASSADSDDNDILRTNIAEARENLAEMENRVSHCFCLFVFNC